MARFGNFRHDRLRGKFLRCLSRIRHHRSWLILCRSPSAFTFHLERACVYVHSDGCFYRYRRWPHVCNRCHAAVSPRGVTRSRFASTPENKSRSRGGSRRWKPSRRRRAAPKIDVCRWSFAKRPRDPVSRTEVRTTTLWCHRRRRISGKILVAVNPPCHLGPVKNTYTLVETETQMPL